MKTFLDPSYKKTSHGHRKIEGVQFNSYQVGIMSYAKISEDGQIIVWSPNSRRDGASRYAARIVGHGEIMNASGNPKRFNSEEAACAAAVKIVQEKG